MMTVVIDNISFSIQPLLHSSLQSSQQSSQKNASLYSSHFQNFDDLSVRKRTFLLWPQWAAANGDDLSEAGFHYTGIRDEVACHACHMKHSNWQRLDDPLEVHLREGHHCMVARGRSAALASQVRGRNNPVHRRHQRRVRREFSDSDEDELRPEPVETNVPSGTPIIVPRQAATRVPRPTPNLDLEALANETERVLSFKGKWKQTYPLSHKDLARAGFFYKGPGDRVQCAFCKGILKDWEQGDNALGEHARHFPACQFVANMNSEATSVLKMRAAEVMLNMGYDEKDVIEAVVNLQKKGLAQPSTDDLVGMLFEMSDVQTKQIEEIQEEEEESEESFSGHPEALLLKKENAALRQSALCKVCYVATVDTLLLPCRHLSCCAACAADSDFCPVCRAKILGTVKTFVS